MNRNVAIVGVVALMAVSAIALAAITPGFMGNSSASSTTTSSTQPPSQTTSSTQSTGNSAGQGAFALMAADPPLYGPGVSAVYATYSNVQMHNENAKSEASGWLDLNVTGSLDLTGIVNASRTIASTKIQSGTYNMLRLNVTSATVTYENQNYSASVRTGELTMHIVGGVQVNGSAQSAALVDIRSFVINSGNSSSPTFEISASAKAAVVPRSALVGADMRVGARVDLNGSTWWKVFEDETTARLSITAASLTSGSLDLTVTNTGNGSEPVSMVVVTPEQLSGNLSALPPYLAGSAVFAVNQNGSLAESSETSIGALFGGTGYNLTGGASATFAYSGTIQLGLGPSVVHLAIVSPGQKYLVTVIGEDSSASSVVVAS